MIYLDSNILAYNFLDRGARGENVARIMRAIDNKGVESVTSALALDELMWVFVKNGRRDSVYEAINGIYESNIKIVPVTSQAPLNACPMMKSFGLAPRDAIHLAVMKENHISEILTEDKHFESIEGIRRYSIKDFLGRV